MSKKPTLQEMVQANRHFRDERYRQPTHTRCRSAEDFGASIRLRRKELGYTQEALSKRMRVSPRLIGELEHGRSTVAIGTVLKLCNNLGLDVTITVRGQED
jgi:ribosome-binding protein aMBF1 (putative translation factor)